MAEVAVLVVNFNGGGWLERCLTAVRGQRPLPAEVLVIDNASTDGSADALPDGVRLVSRADNGGFGAGVAAGLAATRAPFVLVLNPDALLQPGCLEAAVAALESDATLGSVALRVLQAGHPERLDASAVGLTSRLGQINVHAERPATEIGLEPVPALGPLGGAALYRRSALEQAGGYPTHYFLYWEDMHVALHLLNAGWGCRTVPAALVHHEGGASVGHHSARNVFYMARNHWPCLIASLPPETRRRHALALIIAPLRAGLLYAGRGRPLAAFAGLLCGLWQAARAWPTRPRQGHPAADQRLSALMASDDAHRVSMKKAESEAR